MTKPNQVFTAKLLGALLLLALGLCLPVQADTVYITTYGSGGVSSSTLTLCQPNVGLASVCLNPLGFGGSISTYGSTATANPPGVPARSKCIYGWTNYPGPVNWSLQPGYLAPGAVYALYTAHSNNGATNVQVTAFSLDGTVSPECTNSTAFDKAHSGNTWYLIGYFTNGLSTTQPTINFYASGGYLDNNNNGPGGSQRLYIDAFMFQSADPCLGVAGNVTVVGPLVAGATLVPVSGISSGATNVSVYNIAGLIGETNYAGGFAAGTVSVPVTGLYQGDTITAKQTKNGCVGNLSSAEVVGGGPNPPLQVALGVGKNSALTGPIGAAAGGAGTPQYWIHANGRRSQGYGVGPTGGYVVTPSANWVTLTFNSDTDEVYDYGSNTFPYTNTDNYAVLYSLALAIDDVSPDIGPYKIYIDSIYNGTNLIQGFEGYTNGTYGVMFSRPGANPLVAGMLYPQPDTNYVNNAGGVNADTGTNSLLVNWAFKSLNPDNWVNLVASGSGTQYPVIDLHQPITVRMLVLPVGQTVGNKFNGDVSFINNSPSGFWTGGSNTLSVTVAGSGSYAYQWSYNHNDISGANGPAYTLQPLTGITAADAGLYTVTVTDGAGGSIARSLNVYNIGDPVPTITNQLANTVLVAGTPASLSIGVDGHVPWGYPLTYQWYHDGNPVGTSSSTYALANPQVADAGAYQVVINNTYGAVTSAVAQVSISTVAPGTGTGLRADYYTLHTNNVNNFVGVPTLTRTDATVDFNWGTGSPAASISADYFMARWSGQVQALGADTYTFMTVSDDGVRLWLNGQPIINNWTLHAPTTNTASVVLTANQKCDLMLEYFEQTGGAVAQLMWSNTTGVTQSVIPASQLYPASAPVVPTLTTSVSNGTNLTLNWAAGTYTVLGAGKVSGPYTNVAVGAAAPYNIIIGSQPQMFYRLKVQ